MATHGVAIVGMCAALVAGRSARAEMAIFADAFEDGSLCAWASQDPSVCADAMVFVPSGEFTMGKRWQPGTYPVHVVNLSAYWIDRYEVTVEGYAACVTAGPCTVPNGTYSEDPTCNWSSPRSGNDPINCVDWLQGQAYCAWAEKRFPTEAEWEKAARGIDARTYPWGEALATCDRAVMDGGCGLDSTWPVGSKPAGASPYGVLDMAGNVGEWVADWLSYTYYEESPTSDPPGPASGTYRSLRGGNWEDAYFLELDFVVLGSTFRRGALPTLSNGLIGFRCARDG